MLRQDLLNLLIQGIGENRTAYTNRKKNERVEIEYLGEKIFRRAPENFKAIDFSIGAPKEAGGCFISRTELDKEGARYYTVEFYKILNKLKR